VNNVTADELVEARAALVTSFGSILFAGEMFALW
jgi:hypothetical protein